MTIRVLVSGAFGKMGLLTVKTISEQADFELVGQTGREYNLEKSIKDSNADVVIDFTTPLTVYENTLCIIEKTDARPLIGTSGLKSDEIDTLQALAKKRKRGGLIAPNFSLGAVLMIKTAKEIAKYMKSVEIIEMHHNNKLDSPSGTAIRTAEVLSKMLGDKAPPPETHENVEGTRGGLYKNIPIHAIRLPGFLAHQEIIFGNTGETLSIRHDSIDRSAFMPGICLAIRKVMDLEELVYGLEEVL